MQHARAVMADQSSQQESEHIGKQIESTSHHLMGDVCCKVAATVSWGGEKQPLKSPPKVVHDVYLLLKLAKKLDIQLRSATTGY